MSERARGTMTETAVSKNQGLDVASIREDFPILRQSVHGKPLAYLDNAATTQKPRQVIEAVKRFYEEENSNIHRGVHYLSQQATRSYEGARKKVKDFINAKSTREILFVRGATEGVNLVAQTYGRRHAGSANEILISAMEHHSNIVPWQMLCEQVGARLRVIPMNAEGELELDALDELIGPQTAIVGIVQLSNALGTINPVKTIIEKAHGQGVPVLVDAAQSIPHLRVDVRELDADFVVFSGHKMYGPTGIGAVYARESLLETMPPYQGGGDMISSVTFERTTYNELPHKFEAGTPNVAGAVGLGAAIDYLGSIGLDKIEAYESALLDYGLERLQELPEVRMIGRAREKASVISFLLEGVHPHDIGTIVDQEGVAIRTGHHCAQPVMDFYGIPATARASISFYNTKEELDLLAETLQQALKVFR